MEQLPAKEKETLSRAMTLPVFLAFMLFFFADLYTQNLNLAVSAVGIALTLIGSFYYAKSVRGLGEFFSTNIEIKHWHKLITTGSFGFVRHPLYLCAIAIYAGISLTANSLACAALLVLFFLPWTAWRIRLEEKMLAREFGKEFQEYKKAVPAVIPKLF